MTNESLGLSLHASKAKECLLGGMWDQLQRKKNMVRKTEDISENCSRVGKYRICLGDNVFSFEISESY